MVRKGWSVQDDLSKALWKQILVLVRLHEVASGSAGSIPEMASTTEKGQAEFFCAAAEEGTHHSGEVDKKRCLPSMVHRQRLEKAKAEVVSREPIRASPDEVRSAALAKIARLEAAITALGPDNSLEKTLLEEALQKVKKGAKMTPVGERLDSCLQFIERASKRLQLCESDLAQVLQKKSRLEDELAQARRNLEVLRAEASETAAAAPPPPHASGEVEQLQPNVAKLRMEKEDSKSVVISTEVVRLRAELQEVQKERDCLRHGQQVTPMELQTTASSRMAALIDDADAKHRCVVHHIP